MSSIGLLRLESSTEPECETSTRDIGRIGRVLEKCIICMLSRPIDQYSIRLTRISVTMFIYSYPDTDIHRE
jgi:hypothetical protein